MPVQLELAWQEPLTGTVLANTPGRDVAISWQERGQSVLALRTLPSASSPGERVLALSWSRWNDDAGSQTSRQLGLALGRLQRALGGGGAA
jgi:hypothetical protein